MARSTQGGRKQPIQTNKSSSADAPPPRHLIEQFLENQKSELNLRAQELELKKQADKNNFTYAQQALTAQAEDRQLVLKHLHNRRRDTYWLVSGIAVLIAIVIIGAIYLNAKDIAATLIQAIVFIGSGGAGGYALGRHQGKTDQRAEDEE